MQDESVIVFEDNLKACFICGTVFGMAFDLIKGTDQVQERTRGGISGFFRIKEFSPDMSPAPGMFKRQILIARIHVANNRSAIILKEFFRHLF